MIIFNVWEWIRLLCYVCVVPSACYLAVRAYNRHEGMHTLMWSGMALLFSWYLVDLTMVSLGISSRETRSFATPITVFVTGGIVVMALQQLRVQWHARQMRNSLAQLDGTLNGMQH